LIRPRLAGAHDWRHIVQVAQAQLAVIDPANLIENIISAVAESRSRGLNQITCSSEHEVQSLANQAQNLQSMPSSQRR
jgi:P-type conjugative transfer protein TrbJ